jgi:hypothetical protein
MDAAVSFAFTFESLATFLPSYDLHRKWPALLGWSRPIPFQCHVLYALIVFGGNVLLVQLVLAFAGAMFVGSVMALVRPPAKRPKGATYKVAPKGRTIAMALLGGFVSLWAIASLLSR